MATIALKIFMKILPILAPQDARESLHLSTTIALLASGSTQEFGGNQTAGQQLRQE
jgi:hypothetical protein